MRKRILIVDDEKNIVDILKFNLNKESFDTLEAYDGKTALAVRSAKSRTLFCWTLCFPKWMDLLSAGSSDRLCRHRF